MQTTLLMRLAGPMQAWGHRSRFDNRDTALEPTRSGVIGLLCAALGRDSSTDLTPFDSLEMGVRVEKEGRVAVDYHTAANILRHGPNAPATVTQRYYLADAHFLVGLESSDVEFLQLLDSALRQPKWALFLGRKAFPLSLPAYVGNSGLRQGSLAEVLRAEPWHALTDKELSVFGQEESGLRLILETKDPRKGIAISDVPRDFARRRFGIRYLTGESCVPESKAKFEVML